MTAFPRTQDIADKFLDFCRTRKVILQTAVQPVFYALPLPGRMLLVVDPETIANQRELLSSQFRHDLATRLAGRRVVVTNSRGIFFQIGYEPEPAPKALKAEALDLTQQISPLHVPLGMTKNGPLWLSIPEMDSALIGGSRRMGKTRLLHGWIQALLRGGRCRLVIWDGKGGMEFARYANRPGVTYTRDLREALVELTAGLQRRGDMIRKAGVSSLPEYNELAASADRMEPVVLVVDEVASIPEDTELLLADLVGRGGAYGIYPILATTYPGSKEVQALTRANMSTRICLPVPTHYESKVILGQTGAEKLPKVRGRMLMVLDARLVEVQSFNITVPTTADTIYMGPMLSDRECFLVRQAVEAGGVISINLITQWDSTYTPHAGRRLLEEWEGRGWVVKDPQRANSRVLTSLLLEIFAQTTQASQTPQTSQTDSQTDQGPVFEDEPAVAEYSEV